MKFLKEYKLFENNKQTHQFTKKDFEEMFIDLIDEGYDIVLGWRHDRKDFFISRKLPSKIANWLVRKVTGIPVKDNGCAIRAYRAEIIKNCEKSVLRNL